jgi:hypothetical protein
LGRQRSIDQKKGWTGITLPLVNSEVPVRNQVRNWANGTSLTT